MHSARVEEEEMRVATLLMAEFGGWHAFPMEPGLMVCMIENKQDQPTLLVAETAEDLSTELPVLGTEPTIDVAWKWLIIRLKHQLSSINNPPEGTPVVIGPEWEFVIGKLEKDVAQGIKTASECLGGSLPHASLHTTNAGRRHGPSLNHHLWSLLFELESAIGSGVVPSSEVTTRLQQRTQQLLLSKLKKNELYHEIQQSRQENTTRGEPEVNSLSVQQTELPVPISDAHRREGAGLRPNDSTTSMPSRPPRLKHPGTGAMPWVRGLQEVKEEYDHDDHEKRLKSLERRIGDLVRTESNSCHDRRPKPVFVVKPTKTGKAQTRRDRNCPSALRSEAAEWSPASE